MESKKSSVNLYKLIIFMIGVCLAVLALELSDNYGGNDGFLGVDVCQDTCPFFYAASSLISVSLETSFSGFSHTSPTGSQFRVPRLHRSGFRCFAAW